MNRDRYKPLSILAYINTEVFTNVIKDIGKLPTITSIKTVYDNSSLPFDLCTIINKYYEEPDIFLIKRKLVDVISSYTNVQLSCSFIINNLSPNTCRHCFQLARYWQRKN